MNGEIIKQIWYTPVLPNRTILDVENLPELCIGIVAVVIDGCGRWKCYIGYGGGVDENSDAKHISQWGVPLGKKEAACAFFPCLDPEKFEY